MSIVLLGKIGSGKTTFYNKLTNSNEKTISRGESQTRQVFMKQSSYGNGFKVMDTPSFGSDNKKIDHVAGVLSALTEGPLNRLFLLIRFARTSIIINNLQQLLPPFMKYRVMITVVITYWDDCELEDEKINKANIEATLKKYQITSVMYAGKLDKGETLCKQIDQIIANTPQQSVNLTQEEIFRNFDIVECEDEDGYFFELEMQQGEIIRDYHQFYDQAIKLIKEADEDRDDLSDYCNSIIQFAKYYLNDTIKKFQMNSLNKIDQLDEIEQLKAFQIHLDFKLKIFELYEDIVQQFLRKTNQTINFFTHYIRKCYHKDCGQVWIFNRGCGGTTICGRLIDSKQDDSMSHGVPTEYFVTYQKRQLTITRQNTSKINQRVVNQDYIAKNLEKTEKSQSLLKNAKDSQEKIGIGCGRWIKWDQMIQLNEEELKEILTIMDKNFLKQIEQDELNFKDRTQKIQSRYQHQLQAKIAEQRQQTQRNN